MPLQLSDLKAKLRKVPVEWEDETLTVEYWPQRFSPSYQDKVAKMIKTQGQTESDGWAIMLEVLAGWDIMDGDQPVPVNKGTISSLPNSLLMAILMAIRTDAFPNPTSGGTSAAGSLKKGS